MNPISKDIYIFILLAAAVLVFWVINIVRQPDKGLLAFLIIAAIMWLIFKIVDTWFNGITDGRILFALVFNLMLAIGYSSIAESLQIKSLVVGLISMTAILFVSVNFFLNDLSTYLYFVLDDDDTYLYIKPWAENSLTKTDWRNIYNQYPDNEKLLSCGVYTYLSNCEANDPYPGSAWVKNNTAFRDATFEAWAIYNDKHTDPLTVPIPLAAATNAEVMIWWYGLAKTDKRHERNLKWYLTKLNEVFSDDHIDSYLLEKIETCLSQCRNSGLASDELLDVTENVLDSIKKQLEADEANQ
jgi:hypothetical protein